MFRSKITIDLNAVRYNYLGLRSYVDGKTEVSAVLKANAYGLGAKFIAPKLYDAGCRHFWVAYLSEAMALREVLPHDAEIYALQGFEPNDIGLLKAHKITQVINSVGELEQIKGHGLPIVLFVETGLTRLGIKEDEIEQIAETIKTENVRLVMSHLACSGEPDNPYNKVQKDNFDRILSKIRQYKPSVRASLSASGGTFLSNGNYFYDLVRCGSALYSTQMNGNKNVITFETKVLQTYAISANTSVGYDRAYIAPENRKIALLAIGKADGLPSSLTGKGTVLFGKYRSKIIAIAMDLTTCDVTDVPDELTESGCTATLLNSEYSLSGMARDASEREFYITTNFNLNSNRIEVSYIG